MEMKQQEEIQRLQNIMHKSEKTIKNHNHLLNLEYLLGIHRSPL